jgi:hypothetical protein
LKDKINFIQEDTMKFVSTQYSRVRGSLTSQPIMQDFRLHRNCFVILNWRPVITRHTMSRDARIGFAYTASYRRWLAA